MKKLIILFLFLIASKSYAQAPGFNMKNAYPKSGITLEKLDYKKIDSIIISQILNKNRIYSDTIILYNNQRQELKVLNDSLSTFQSELIKNSYLSKTDKKLTVDEVSEKQKTIDTISKNIISLKRSQDILFKEITKNIHKSKWLKNSKYQKQYEAIVKLKSKKDIPKEKKRELEKLAQEFNDNYYINNTKYLISENITEYNYLQIEQDELKNIVSNLENLLYSNSLISEIKLDKKTRKAINDSIKKKKNKVAKNKIILDSLYLEYTKDYLKHKNFSIFSFGPKRSRAFFDMIYDNSGKQFKLINESGFSISNKSGSIYSELVSGNLGIVRVSLGTTISRSANDSITVERQEEAFQRLISNGGNTTLKIEYPIAYLHSDNNQYNLISRILAKGTADFPEFGTSTDKWAGSGSLGLDIYADASLDNNQLRFFASFNINGIFGTSTFRDNLGIDNSNFSFGQLTLGLVIAENLKLSFVLSTVSSERSLRNRNRVLGGQVLH